MNANDIITWKPVVNFETLYEVSNTGLIRSIKSNKILRTFDNGRGYLVVNLSKNNNKSNHTVHRLVYEAFYGTIPTNLTVNHIDEDKSNNNISNLELLTLKENINYGSHNIRSALSRRYCTMENTQKARRVIYCETNFHVYSSAKEAEKSLNIPSGNILSCCKGKRSHAGHYKFRYATQAEIERLNNMQQFFHVFNYSDFDGMISAKRMEQRKNIREVESYSLF